MKKLGNKSILFIKIVKYLYSGDAHNANKSIGKEDSSRKLKQNINNSGNDLCLYDFVTLI